MDRHRSDQIHRQQGDLISLLSTIRVDTQTDGQTQSDQIHRQQGEVT
jgi:hypothetical protein